MATNNEDTSVICFKIVFRKRLTIQISFDLIKFECVNITCAVAYFKSLFIHQEFNNITKNLTLFYTRVWKLIITYSKVTDRISDMLYINVDVCTIAIISKKYWGESML